MKLAGEYIFEAPQDIVWEALQDPDVLGSVMPGGQGVEKIGEDEYAGTLKMKVGPVQGVFKGTIKLTDVLPPVSYHLDVSGRGAPGFVKGGGDMSLEGQGEQTLMRYEGAAQVGGRIATVGQRLVEASARSILEQSLNSLNDYLKQQVVARDAAGADEQEEGADSDAGDEAGEDAGSAPESAPAAASSDSGDSGDSGDSDDSGDSAGSGEASTGQAPQASGAAQAAQAASKARPSPTPSPPPYEPPSMVDIGLNVAKDVTRDLIPAAYRPVALLIIAFFVGILTCRLCRE